MRKKIYEEGKGRERKRERDRRRRRDRKREKERISKRNVIHVEINLKFN